MMNRLFSAGAMALAMTAALAFSSQQADARPTKMCFKTGNGKSYVAALSDGFLVANGRACSGNSVFTVDFFTFNKGQPPRVGPPINIKAANGRYVQFYGGRLRATAARINPRDRRFQFAFRTSHGDIKGAQPLKPNMRVNLYPMLTRFSLMTSADRGGGAGLRNIRRTSSRIPATFFTLTAVGGKTPPKKKPAQAKRWTPYGGEYDAPVFTKVGNLVTATGLIKGGSYGHLWTLPKGLAPRQRLVFNINNHAKSSRVDVLPDGKIVWVAGGRDHNWLSLSGIKFSLKPTGRLKLASGWQPYGGAYAPPTFTRQGNMVTVGGLIKNGKHGQLATLPKGMTPRGRLIFNLNNHGKSARIDVLPDGKIVWVAGGRDHKWLSLSGIAFSIAPMARAKLVNGWVPYGNGYATATASRQGNMVTLSGLIKGKKYGHLASLPKGFAPSKRVIYTVNNHHNQARVDVLPDGRILWVAGAKDHGWLSLAGIAYKTNQKPPAKASGNAQQVAALKKRIAGMKAGLANHAKATRAAKAQAAALQKKLAAMNAQSKKMMAATKQAEAQLKKLMSQ